MKLKTYFAIRCFNIHWFFVEIWSWANEKRAEAFLAKKWKTRKFYMTISKIARFFANAFLKLA